MERYFVFEYSNGGFFVFDCALGQTLKKVSTKAEAFGFIKSLK